VPETTGVPLEAIPQRCIYTHWLWRRWAPAPGLPLRRLNPPSATRAAGGGSAHPSRHASGAAGGGRGRGGGGGVPPQTLQLELQAATAAPPRADAPAPPER
jgi:hypothetical protein